MKKPWALVVLLGACVLSSGAAAPVVSNVRASQRPGMALVDIYYDLSDADSTNLAVSVAVSTNDGATYNLSASSLTGDGIGSAVTPGSRKLIIWNAGDDWAGQYSDSMRFKVTAAQQVQSFSVSLSPTGGYQHVNWNYSCNATISGGSPPYSYLWTYLQRPGDVRTSTNVIFNNIFTTIGQKWVKVEVTDAHGAVAVSATNYFVVPSP